MYLPTARQMAIKVRRGDAPFPLPLTRGGSRVWVARVVHAGREGEARGGLRGWVARVGREGGSRGWVARVGREGGSRGWVARGVRDGGPRRVGRAGKFARVSRAGKGREGGSRGWVARVGREGEARGWAALGRDPPKWTYKQTHKQTRTIEVGFQ